MIENFRLLIALNTNDTCGKIISPRIFALQKLQRGSDLRKENSRPQRYFFEIKFEMNHVH